MALVRTKATASEFASYNLCEDADISAQKYTLHTRYVGLENDPEHAHNYRDAVELGDCDAGTRRLCQLLGWEEELVAACDALGLGTPAMH